MIGLELDAVHEWFQTTLNGDATLTAYLGDPSEGIFGDEVPDEVLYPYVLHLDMANRDVMTTESTRVLTVATFQVKGVDRAQSFARLRPIAARIDALLHQASGTVTDGIIYFCRRDSTIRMKELDGTTHYRNLGAIYRVWVQGT